MCLCDRVQYFVHVDLDDDIALLYEAKHYIVHCYTYLVMSLHQITYYGNLATNN